MRHYEIINEASWKYSSFASRSWYNPATREFIKIPLEGGSSHAKFVRDHPETFGIAPAVVTELIDKIWQGVDQSDSQVIHVTQIRNEEVSLKKLALDKGWIRVASQDRQNPNKLLLLEGDDIRQIQRLTKLFWYDMDADIRQMMIKCGGQEYRLMNNDQVKAFAMRAELPEEHFAVNETVDLPAGWDLGGAWITTFGRVLPVEHSEELHHSDIALKSFIDDVEPDDDGEYDKYSKDYAVDLAYEHGWIRISTKGVQSFAVEWQAKLSKDSINALFKCIENDPQTYATYEFVLPSGSMKKYDNVKSFVYSLRKEFRS